MNTFSQKFAAISSQQLAGSRTPRAHRAFGIRPLVIGRFATALGALILSVFLGARLLVWASTAIGVALFSAITNAQAASITVALPLVDAPDPTIVNLAETYRNAVLAGDVPAVVSMFRDDAIEMPPFQPPIAGRAALESFYRQSLAAPNKVAAFRFTHTETIAQGNVAYDVGSYSRTMSGGSTGSIEAKGMYVVILKRTGPSWKIAYITYTCDCPLPTRP